MVSSKATTVENHLAELPPERAEVIEAVHDVIVERLPDGYEETMNWGMISDEIPLERDRDTDNGPPLGVLALAAQARHCSLSMNAVYTSPDLLAQPRVAMYEASQAR